MKWDKTTILARLRKLYKAGADLSYNALTKKDQSVVSAAAYHFGSYRTAVERAGIDYAEFLRRPRWTKPRIIQQIKQARRSEQDLNWSAVIKRKDELAKAAFASLQRRLFGGWDRALHAAGLHADEVILYRQWDRATIAFELRERFQAGESVSSGSLQVEEPSLHAAAFRYFGSFDRALRAAKINPADVRKRGKGPGKSKARSR